MLLIENLSAEDIQMITDYRKAFALTDGESAEGRKDFMSTPELLQEWAEKKENLFHLFGDSLLLKRKFQYEKSLDELEVEMSDLSYDTFGRIGRTGKEFLNAYDAMLKENFPRGLWWNCDYDKNDIPSIFMAKMTSPEVLAKNKYEGPTFTISYGEGNTFVVRSGCKISKLLGKIAGIYNLSGYEDFRICHSQILNKRTYSGELVLSIHPLDYMTMSDNEEGWESCMNWRQEGSYRQGTVEMMNSPTVIVAYFKSPEDSMSIPGGGKWNSKRWRQLFIVDERCIASVKAYPYQNDVLTETIMNWIKNLAEKNLNWSFYDDRKESYPFSFEISDANSAKFIFNTRAMYNDFGSINYHHFCISKTLSQESINRWGEIEIPYSGSSQCMICGELDPYLAEEVRLACDNCEEIKYCSYCEERCPELFELDGDYVCADCYEENAVTCDVCGEVHCRDSMNEIKVALEITEDEDSYREGYTSYKVSIQSLYVCNDFEFEKEFLKENRHFFNENEIYREGCWGPVYDSYHLVNLNDLNERGLELLLGRNGNIEEYKEYLKNSWCIRMIPVRK